MIQITFRGEKYSFPHSHLTLRLGICILGKSRGLLCSSIAFRIQDISAMELGNYTEALEYFDKVLVIDPSNKNVLDNKDEALRHQR
jgi:tetratricopeptide (TPR) repeat protein